MKTLISYIEGFPNQFVRGKSMKTKISHKLGVRFEWLWSKRGETRFIIYGIGLCFFSLVLLEELAMKRKLLRFVTTNRMSDISKFVIPPSVNFSANLFKALIRGPKSCGFTF